MVVEIREFNESVLLKYIFFCNTECPMSFSLSLLWMGLYPNREDIYIVIKDRSNLKPLVCKECFTSYGKSQHKQPYTCDFISKRPWRHCTCPRIKRYNPGIPSWTREKNPRTFRVKWLESSSEIHIDFAQLFSRLEEFSKKNPQKRVL